MSPLDIAMRFLKYDEEKVKENLIDSGNFPSHVDRMMEMAQPGPDRDLPRPLGTLSHQALNDLEHGFYKDHEEHAASFGEPFEFERIEHQGRASPIWSAHNLGLGNEENAHPELYHHMIMNELEGAPVDFHEINTEKYLRQLENTPWELPAPQTFNFMGAESKPTSTTGFSDVSGYGLSGPEIGQDSRGFQDIHTGEPMDIAMRLLKAAFYNYSMPTSQVTENIVPFAEAMSEGEEDWQHIRPMPLDSEALEHLQRQMQERNMAHTWQFSRPEYHSSIGGFQTARPIRHERHTQCLPPGQGREVIATNNATHSAAPRDKTHSIHSYWSIGRMAEAGVRY